MQQSTQNLENISNFYRETRQSVPVMLVVIKEAKAKAKLRPAIVALYSTAASLSFLDRRLFNKDLTECLNQRSREQTAWIGLVTPTIRIAKAKEAHLRKQSQHNIREFFLLPTPQLVPSPYAIQIDDRRPPVTRLTSETPHAVDFRRM
jgi:hypothetical protein